MFVVNTWPLKQCYNPHTGRETLVSNAGKNRD